MSHNKIAWLSITGMRKPSLKIGRLTTSQKWLNPTNIQERKKVNQSMSSSYRTLLNIEDIYKYNNTNNKTFTNGINPLKINMEYIQHTYDLHIGVVIKLQSHGL